MVKLQGTAPNQVPTNADLGSLAYADHDNVNLTAADLKLKALSKTKSQTAVDVFIYDTSKDSDGGAWRHRTQHTSWYNEPASNTRGSRKEFPAVAVIVAESNKVTIYDGDDPSLPMWMVFNRDTSTPDASRAWWRNSPVIVASAVTALNGQVCITLNEVVSSSNGLLFLNFPSDNAGRYSDIVTNGGEGLPITETFNNSLISNLPAIVAAVSNDVAMTVLPDAPTDPATGLPVPTIAVATDVGVSVIKDDGTVVSGGENNASWTVRGVFFDADNTLWATEGTVYSGLQRMSVPPFSTVEDIGSPLNTGYGYPFIFPTATNTFGTNRNAPRLLSGSTIYGNQIAANGNGEKLFTGASSGASSVMHNSANVELSSVAYTTSDYATGWMPGDIKMASLADTDTTALSGTALNNTTDYTTEWVAQQSDWTINTTSLVCDGASGAVAFASINFATAGIDKAVGDQLGIRFTVSSYTSGQLDVSFSNGAATETAITGTGTYEFTNTLSANAVLYLISNSGTGVFVGTVENIEIFDVDPDRSVKGRGLGVHGSITKTAVATGADVVAYSGFDSSNNYLKQPYHSGILDGTGQDIFITGWVHRPASGQAVFADFGEVSSGKRRLFYIVGSTDSLAANNGVAQVNPVTVPSDTWVQCGIIWYANDDLKFYINGQEVGTGTLSRTAQTQDNPLYVGGGRIGSNANTKLALIRISATVPTADQIAKIYNDEKFLFQENAKATLYGTSDAVTALAYDDKTQLLHVGTSDGRSEFQGLRRINNTETGVTTAISVSDNLVVEQ